MNFILSSGLGLVLLTASLFVNYYAGIYANSKQSNYVSDVILDNLPVYNMNIVFFEGFLLFWILITLILIYKPKNIPFTLKSISLFILIRSVFITLTHLRDYPNEMFIQADSMFKDVFTFGGDLFFSAHTGMPFLMALVFWKYKKLRWLFLFASVFFAATVLLGHLHYSIDVFGAYFITYSIAKLSEYLFEKDYKYSSLETT